MKKLKALIAGIAGIALYGSAASAADIQVIVPAAPPVVVVPVAPSFDWSGLYVGGSGRLLAGIEAAGQVGFNIVRGSFLFGPQLRLSRDREGRDLFPTPGEDRLRLELALAAERKARSLAEHELALEQAERRRAEQERDAALAELARLRAERGNPGS